MNPGRSDLAAAINVLAAQGWFSQRSEETRARLSAIAKLRNFAKDELVYLAGDPPNGVFGLVAGSLNVSFPRGDGEDYTLHRAGSGFWTAMLTAGATWYVDADKLWAISALNRYEFNSQKEGATYTPGQAYTLEWGISRALSKTVDVGVVGYYQQQVTEDSGSGKTTAERDRVAAVGPEVTVFYPKFKLGWSLRYDYEFMAESRLQGHTVALTITKIF